MSKFVIGGVCAALALSIGAGAAALSQDKTGVQILGDRQKAMRDMQVPNGFFQFQLRGANPDYKTIIAQADIMKANLELSKISFPAHTKDGGDVEGAHVRARNSLWDEWDKVAALFDQAITATDQLKAAAEAGDKPAATAAAQALNKACSDCHIGYRTD